MFLRAGWRERLTVQRDPRGSAGGECSMARRWASPISAQKPCLLRGRAVPDPAKAYCPARGATVQQEIGKGKRRLRLVAAAGSAPAAAGPIPLSILTLCLRD